MSFNVYTTNHSNPYVDYHIEDHGKNSQLRNIIVTFDADAKVWSGILERRATVEGDVISSVKLPTKMVDMLIFDLSLKEHTI